MEDTSFEPVNFNVLPSLKYLASLHSAVMLWMQDDIINVIKSYFWLHDHFYDNDRRDTDWPELVELVSARIDKIGLPYVVAKQIRYVYRQIGVEIMLWLFDRNNLEGYEGNIEFIRDICWTMKGTVDTRRTAEIMIKDPNLMMNRRFQLACKNCLENEIVASWSDLPVQMRDEFLHISDYDHGQAIKLWIYRLTGDLETLKIISCDEEDYTCIPGTEMAFRWFFRKNTHAPVMEYFWSKLTVIEKDAVLSWAVTVAENQDLCEKSAIFLLSQMKREQQENMYKRHMKFLFECLYTSLLYRDFLVPLMTNMWKFLDGKSFIELLEELFVNKRPVYDSKPEGTLVKLNICLYRNMELYRPEDDKYLIIFHNLWLHSPIGLRKYVFVNGLDLLWELLKLGSLENVKLVLSDGSTEEKINLITSELGQLMLFQVMGNGRVSLVHFVLRNVFPSEARAAKFMEHLRRQKLKNEIAGFSQFSDAFVDWPNKSEKELRECRRRFCQSDQAVDIYLKLIEKSLWPSLALFNEICFTSDAEFAEFQKRLVGHQNDDIIVRCIVDGLKSCKTCYWFCFDQILSYFVSTEEVSCLLKNGMLCRNIAQRICVELLEESMTTRATIYLKWLFLSEDEIKTFKCKLWLLGSGIKPLYARILSAQNGDVPPLFSRNIYLYSQSLGDSLQKMLCWYLPCQDVEAEFTFLFRWCNELNLNLNEKGRYLLLEELCLAP